MKGNLVRSCFPMAGLACLLLAWVSLPTAVLSQQHEGDADPLNANIQVLDSASTAPDAYEPDNTWLASKVIILNDQEPHPELPSYKPIQTHNFHMAGDEDWVKFFLLKGEIYKISVDSPGDKCDVVIGIYDIDGQTLIKEVDDTFAGEKEYAEWECTANGVYYARIRQYNREVFGEGTAYQLSLTQPYMTFNGFIFGTVTPAVEAKLSTGLASALAVDGEFFMPHIAGDFTLQVVADGCVSYSVPITVVEIADITVDVVLECDDFCLAVAGDLTISVPCAEYLGNRYGFTLNFYSNPDDPSGLYWEMVLATFTTGEGTDCIPIGGDLSMPIPCAAYSGTQYGFTLRFYNNPYDPSGLYWKMDLSTFSVK